MKITRPDVRTWQKDLATYAHADRRRAFGQLLNTFVPYIGLWVLMVYTVRQGLPYWLTLALMVVAIPFLTRIFIFFHDAGHGSFFNAPWANTAVGYVCGILTFTAYHDWRAAHARHHATAGDLDRRGTGDVYVMTVDEYRAAPRLRRLGYRFFRNPGVLFGLGPIFIFFISQRFAHKGAKKRERLSVAITNLALLAIILVAGLTIGLKAYVVIQLPLMFLAGVVGIWLFYVQHQFEGVYWARHEEWDFYRAGLEGSSYYKLPRVLQWMTGNIGLHHVHHLRPGIPNYRLQDCHDAVPAAQAVKPLTFRRSLCSLRLNIYDEQARKLVGFRALRSGPRAG